MPFNSTAGYEFSESGIAVYAREISGVYGIYSGRRWIYIDETHDIRMCLYDHLHGVSQKSAQIIVYKPAYFVFERADQARRSVRRKELVSEYRPCCNLR
jgi:hypothetical protein